MSCQVKGSCNWKKARSKVQRIHAEVANARLDFLHKASRTLARTLAMVCIEDWVMRNMSRSAKGNVNSLGQK